MKIEILKHNTFREFLANTYSYEEKEGYISIKESLIKEIKSDPYYDYWEDRDLEFWQIVDSFKKQLCTQSILRLTDNQFIQLADRFCLDTMRWLYDEFNCYHIELKELLEPYQCGEPRMTIFNEFAVSFLIDMYYLEIREICGCKEGDE